MSSNKMFSYVNHKLHVTLGDGRLMSGLFIAYDKHMNLVLSDVVETRPLSKKDIPPRNLGLVLVRGEHVVSVRAEKKVEAASGSAIGTGEGATKEAAGVAVPVPGSAIPTIPGGKAKAAKKR